MEDKQIRVSHKELRETFYKLRDFEISNLWQRSIFLSALLVLFFPAYGVLVSKILDGTDFTYRVDLVVNNGILVSKILEGTDNTIIYNEICCALALCAIAFSIIWIMMAKGSKAWYEVYEIKICEIEKEEDLEIEEEYSMGGMGKKTWKGADTNLMTNKAGQYSVSKLNILIGRFLMIIWTIIFAIHYIISWVTLCNINCNCIPHTIILTLLPVFLTVIIWTASCNCWAKSSVLQKKAKL